MKIIKSICLAGAIAFAGLLTANATTTVLISGPAAAGVTNIAVNGTNYATGYVPAAATNYYNMPTVAAMGNNTSVASSQSNTNQFPSAAVSLTGYPNTLYGPANNVGFMTTINEQATNATTTIVKFVYAGSDGYNWYSNYFAYTVTIPQSITTNLSAIWWTNVTTGALPFLALQEIDNTNASLVITNIVITASEKPGL